MDDPLSAVDAHVGNHIFSTCIKEYLNDSTVILVTHQFKYLKAADIIVVLNEGRIQQMGTFEHLVNNGLNFSAYLSSTYSSEPDMKESNELFSKEETLKDYVSENKVESSGTEVEDLNLIENKDITGVSRRSTMSASFEKSLNPKLDETVELLPDKIRQVEPQEQKSVGTVNIRVFTKYFGSGGNWVSGVFMLILLILCQIIYAGSDLWISYWSTLEESRQEKNNFNTSTISR